jgi:hypothetical protein
MVNEQQNVSLDAHDIMHAFAVEASTPHASLEACLPAGPFNLSSNRHQQQQHCHGQQEQAQDQLCR